MKRLRFVHAQATVDQEDTIYIAAMRNIARDAKFPESTQALHEIASVYEGYGYLYDLGNKPAMKGYLRKAEEVCDQAIARFPYSYGGLQCKEIKSRMTGIEIITKNELIKKLEETQLRCCQNDAYEEVGRMKERARILSHLANKINTEDTEVNENRLKFILQLMQELTKLNN